MSEVKVFRVTGEVVKPNLRTKFQKEVRATKPENVKERIYKEFGSKHRAKRFHIKIYQVEEISTEQIESPLIRKLTLEEESNDK